MAHPYPLLYKPFPAATAILFLPLSALTPPAAPFILPAMELRRLLDRVAQGKMAPARAHAEIEKLREKNLGFARVDTDRLRRRGFPEVIFGQGKTPAQVVAIVTALHEAGQNVLATRVTAAHYTEVSGVFPRAVFHEAARVLTLNATSSARRVGLIAVLCAGTTDIPVAEEAALVAEHMGARVQRVYDVGVAGLHRLIRHLPAIKKARALVVAAGMEGALPSVVGGLTECPIIAVPTSIGYGASMQGLTALLAMLNTCVPGITVVNIDNGFGAGVAAALINRLPERISPMRKHARGRRP
jgi:NCAIR mutase (PurE)-related protein